MNAASGPVIVNRSDPLLSPHASLPPALAAHLTGSESWSSCRNFLPITASRRFRRPAKRRRLFNE